MRGESGGGGLLLAGGLGAGVGGEEILDFEFEEFAAHPVEGAVNGAGFDGEAGAGVKGFLGPGAVGREVAEVDGADGNFGGAAAGAGEAGDAEGVIGAKFFGGAGDHGDGGFGADGAVLLKNAFGDVEELDFGVVGVGNHAAEENIGRAGNVGEGIGEKATGAGLGDGEGGFAGAEFIEDDLSEGVVAEADKILAEDDANLVTDGFELGRAEVTRAGGDADVHLALVGAKGEAEARIFVHDGPDALLNANFRYARRANLQIGVAGEEGAGFAQARNDLGFKHGAQFVGRAGEHDEDFAVLLQIDAWGGAKAVGEELGAVGAEALLAVVGRHGALEAQEAFSDGGFGGRVEFEREAEDAGDGFAGIVVGSGAEATGGDDDVGGLPAIAKGSFDVGRFVADDEAAAKGEAEAGELTAEEVEVGVGAEAEEEFVAEGEEVEFFHKKKELENA